MRLQQRACVDQSRMSLSASAVGTHIFASPLVTTAVSTAVREAGVGWWKRRLPRNNMYHQCGRDSTLRNQHCCPVLRIRWHLPPHQSGRYATLQDLISNVPPPTLSSHLPLQVFSVLTRAVFAPFAGVDRTDADCVGGYPPKAYTYSETVTLCTSLGLELCAKDCGGTGCDYNKGPVWTNLAC